MSYAIIKRDEIKNAPQSRKTDHSERLVIWLGKRFLINKGEFLKLEGGAIGQIPYRYTTLQSIRTPIKDKLHVLKVG